MNKRKGEKYTLKWRESPDFMRLAANRNAVVVPFAAVGGDDAYDLVLDTDEVLDTSLLPPPLESHTVSGEGYREASHSDEVLPACP